MLVCAYLLRLQRKNDLEMEAICQEDLITEWSHPSLAMQSAATLVQANFRRAKYSAYHTFNVSSTALRRTHSRGGAIESLSQSPTHKIIHFWFCSPEIYFVPKFFNASVSSVLRATPIPVAPFT